MIGYGVLMGTSAALFEVTRTVVLRQHFDRHYGLANGIVGVGSSLAYVVLPPGAELVLRWGAPPDASEAQLRDVRTSNLCNVMLIVAAAYLTQIVCLFLWTDDLQKKRRRDNFKDYKSETKSWNFLKKISIRKLFKWHLFRNRDLLFVTFAQAMSCFADVQYSFFLNYIFVSVSLT